MNTVEISVICLLLAFGVSSQNEDSTTFDLNEDPDAYSTSFENLLNETVDSTLETTEDPDKSNHTGIDTGGDTIITRNPTENDHSSDDTPTFAEGNSTDISTDTDTSSTTMDETTTEQTHWKACSSNPCQNEGTCVEDNSDPKFYNCNCTHGYTGTHCQVSDSCTLDEYGNICNEGACVYAKDGLSRSCKCFFGMFWDEDINKCKKAKPPCFPNPCQNGICESNEGGFQCSCHRGFEGKTCDIRNMCGEDDDCENGRCKEHPEKKTKYCECHSDFYWNEDSGKCEAVERPCVPNPCKNGGNCKPASSEEFDCTCAKGYVGQLCETENFCIASEADEDMTCNNGVCVDSERGKICHCNDGFYLDEESHVCREIIEPCLPSPCSNEGKCISLSLDSYNCSCSEGYYGSACTERDYCVLDGGNTFCGDASCRNNPGLGIYYCSCSVGQYFDYKSRTCFDLDFCPLMKCGENEECKYSECRCKEKYRRDNSTGGCQPYFCPSNPCPVKDLMCTEGDGTDSYQCACESGSAFDGKQCKAGASCIFPDKNSCYQNCMPEENGYSCSCENDFLLNSDNATCEYIGNLTCTNKTCNNGICVRTGESETCICWPGFEEKEDNCVDLCTAGHLPDGYCPDNKCEVTDSGFRCKCEGKYTYDDDGITCKVRKMCDEGEIGWKTCSRRHSLCSDDWSTADGFTCHCTEGQVATEGGFCRDICSIEENQKQCSVYGAECDVDARGEKTCKCPPYFLPFENGTACSKPASNSYLLTLPLKPSVYRENERNKRSADMKYADVDYRSVEQDVRKAMKRLFPELLYSNVLNCRETENYIKCKVELQFVSIGDGDLKKLQLPELCQASEDSSSACLLPPSLILQKEHLKTVVFLQRTDPCDADIKENLCGSETFCKSVPHESEVKCRCEAGFSVRSVLYPFGDTESFIENCKDIDECATENPCQENMNCHNTLGSYTCSCKPGYRTKDLSKPETSGCVGLCTPNRCVHGDCMKIGDHNFECKCSPGYNGLLCDLQDENFKHARTNTIIVGAVLGGILLVVIILSIASISRLKKKKEMLENSERMLYGSEMTERRGGEAGAVNNAYRRD